MPSPVRAYGKSVQMVTPAVPPRDDRADQLAEGIGRALLDAAEARLRSLGAQRIDAMVLDGDDVGQELWTAAGYRRQEEWRRWVKGVKSGMSSGGRRQ